MSKGVILSTKILRVSCNSTLVLLVLKICLLSIDNQSFYLLTVLVHRIHARCSTALNLKCICEMINHPAPFLNPFHRWSVTTRRCLPCKNKKARPSELLSVQSSGILNPCRGLAARDKKKRSLSPSFLASVGGLSLSSSPDLSRESRV